MKKILVLEGHQYNGLFSLEEHICTFTNQVSTEIGYHNETTTYRNWEGEGIITDKLNKQEQKFLIYPRGCDESNFIIFDENREEIIKRIQDYKGIIDIVLQSMYEKSLNSEEIIAKIKPESLGVQRLMELGLVIEESGQIRLPLVA